jgi:hypothetical protein
VIDEGRAEGISRRRRFSSEALMLKDASYRFFPGKQAFSVLSPNRNRNRDRNRLFAFWRLNFSFPVLGWLPETTKPQKQKSKADPDFDLGNFKTEEIGL